MRISILIPAHNEERSIKATVESCLAQTRPADEVIVVNDGSTDNTAKVLAAFGNRITVVTIPVATGNKSFAQQHGLDHVNGDVFIATDGDTILDSRFVEMVEGHFDNPDVGAVAGYVKSIKNNWLTACREIDYTIGQDLHKKAQANMNFLFVIPGCAGAFRRSTFNDIIEFEHDTLTEDLDFTYKFHETYSRIVFEPRAIVYTQDPFTLYAYVNQIRRWYSGGWQNLKKHMTQVIHRPFVALELSLTYIEGVVFSALLFVLPLVNIKSFGYFLLSYYFVVLGVSVYAAIRRRRFDLILASPLYLMLVFVNSAVFLEQFFREIILRKHMNIWFKPERAIEIN